MPIPVNVGPVPIFTPPSGLAGPIRPVGSFPAVPPPEELGPILGRRPEWYPLGLQRAERADSPTLPLPFQVFGRYPAVRPGYRSWLRGLSLGPLEAGTLADSGIFGVYSPPHGGIRYAPELPPEALWRTMMHEYAHALTNPPPSTAFYYPGLTSRLGSDWRDALIKWVMHDDPVYGRLQDSMRPYRIRGDDEVYAEMAAKAGSLAGIPPALREFFPWLGTGSALPPEPEGPTVGMNMPGSLPWALVALDAAQKPGASEWLRPDLQYVLEQARIARREFPEWWARYAGPGSELAWLEPWLATPRHLPEGM